jgi:protocatechuate 3,4-dioxygenase beta subunit
MPALGSLPAGSYERITTVTRADGSYRIDNIPPGQNRTLICRAPGFGTMSATLEFKGQVERPIAQNFRMRPGLTISGRVIEQGGAPIPSASIDALFFGQGESARGNGKSVEGGRFEVADLAAGSYMLIATAEGFSDWRQNGIEAGTSNIEITLRRQGAISGRVLADDTGSPLRTFECSLRMSVGNQTPLGRTIKTQSFRDAEGGAFTLVGVETGTYVVQATALGYAPTLSDPIEVVDGRPTGDVLVRMTKGGSLVGRVVDPNGKPVKDARVSTQDNNFVENELMAMLGGFVPRNTTHATALTDSNGSYELALLSPGIYQVRIDHASYTKQVMNDLRVTEGSPVEVAPVRLTKGAVVRGRVYGSDGAPLQGAKVELRGPNPETRVPYADSTTTDNEGRYVITRVPSGSFTLHASNSLVANSADPFQAIIDMKRSETRIVVVEGKEYTQELYLGG